MKNFLFLFAIALGLCSINASASPLYVNGVQMSGVNVSGFSYENGELKLHTNVGLVVEGSENGGGEGEGSATLSLTSSSYSLVGTQTATITLAFGGPVTGFDAGDVQVSGGTIGSLTKNGNTYTTTLTPNMSSTSINVSVNSGSYSFLSGSPGVGASITITWEPAQGGEPGGDCESDANVICAAPLEWTKGESNTMLSVPKGKAVAMPFTTTNNASFAGAITFLNYSQMVSREVWISEEPGKPAGPLTNTGFNSMYCKSSGGGGSITLRWNQGAGSVTSCKLAINTQYYLNIRNTSTSAGTSSVQRTRTHNGNP